MRIDGRASKFFQVNTNQSEAHSMSNMKTSRRTGVLVAILAAIAASLASYPASAQTADAKQMEDARRAVDKARGAVVFEAPGGAFDVSKFRGKTLYFVSIDSVPFIEKAYAAMEEAGKPLGISMRMISGRGQTAAVADGINKAIAAKAGAILVGSAAFKFIPEAVKAANEAGIPIVGLLNVSSGQAIPKGSNGEVTLDYRESGELLVAWAVANTKGAVNGVYVDIPAVDTFAAMKQGIGDGFSKYCPSCKHRSIEVQQASFKTQMETKTQAELRRDPKTNWIFPAIDMLAQLGVPAVQAVGRSDVRIGSINAVEANLGFIQKGTVQAVDVGNNNAWMGYASLDRLMRAMAGEPPTMSKIPIRLFDATNLKGANVADEDSLFGVDYRAEYRKLWKTVP